MNTQEPAQPTAEQRPVLERVAELLRNYGIANDADDHGARAEAAQLRLDASAGLRDLTRTHAFLAGLFPGLAPAIDGPFIETTSWARLLDAAEKLLQTVHVDLIPWDRVVRFDGRATDVPEWIAELGRDRHARAEERLLQALVRKDRIVQATPLAVRQILGALRFGLVRDSAAVKVLLDRIAAAARRVEGAAPVPAPARASDWWPFRERHLWPRFESAEEDRRLWQAWRPTAEETLGWASLTRQQFEEHARFTASGPPPADSIG